jgi:hypothetical protein
MSATTDPPEGSPTTTAAARPPGKPRFGRRAVVWLIVVIASVLGVVSILSSWANQQALDNENWRETSEEIIQNPKVAPALSAFLVDQLYSNVDLAAELGAQLPPVLKPLAGPAVSALREPATDNVEKLLARPRLQERFVNASDLAHQKFINVVKNETGHGIATGDGVVTLDTSQLITEVGQNLGVPQAVMSKIPANTGVITIMESDQLGAAQTAVQGIGILDVWLAPFVILLFALAIYLARGFRRETLRNIGWAFVLVGITVLVIRRIGGNYVVNELVAAPNRPVMHDVWLTMTSILGSIGRGVVLYGIFAIAGAVLAGPTRAATAVRRWMAPTLNHRPGMAWAIAGFLYLLLVLWGPTNELHQPVWIVILAAMVAFGVYALRRQTLREFPDALPGGFIASARSAWDRLQGGGGRQGDASAAELTRLGEMRREGLITDDEFAAAKARALA